MAERSEIELQRKLLAELSARSYDSSSIQAKATSLFVSSLAVSTISVLTLFPVYSPRILGLILTLVASVVAIAIVMQVYTSVSGHAKYVRRELIEMMHELNLRASPEYHALLDRIYSMNKGSYYEEGSTYWGIIFIDLFSIIISVLKYYDFVHF